MMLRKVRDANFSHALPPCYRPGSRDFAGPRTDLSSDILWNYLLSFILLLILNYSYHILLMISAYFSAEKPRYRFSR